MPDITGSLRRGRVEADTARETPGPGVSYGEREIVSTYSLRRMEVNGVQGRFPLGAAHYDRIPRIRVEIVPSPRPAEVDSER